MIQCILKFIAGKIPHHIAVLMDGNRRYARKNNITDVEAQVLGYYNLPKLVHWCKRLGIHELTVYAFSIENFKRSEKEIGDFFKAVKEELEKIENNLENSMLRNTRIKFIGNLALLPKDLREVLTKLIFKTKNGSFLLTVAIAYTSKDELTTAVTTIVKNVQNNSIRPKDINEDIISANLFTNFCNNPDIVIRTSGEVRISNFLLWQSGNSIIYFVKTLWPNFSAWHLVLHVYILIVMVPKRE
ncbi:putative undecaprenyl diphosphate synthase [Popillia japonica]|uniref:Alkyl transferase n=1 Tax=Popillia japonica TaxID=7064 RepID=A0AAW1KP98_POPJA